MYQLNNQAKWDTEYLHELMDGRIRSSDKAKKIREELMNQGALPQLDNHFDWAMLCIGYCFIKGWANQPHSLIKDGLDNRGVEIPSFKTCFQDYSRLWLVMLSDALFEAYPNKELTKEDLYEHIRLLWHTGAIELNKFWEGCQHLKGEGTLESRQLFLNELADLAMKNTKKRYDVALSMPTGKAQMDSNRQITEKLENALRQSNIPVKALQFEKQGVRYDIYRLRLTRYVDFDKAHAELCSALGVSEAALHIVPCRDGESHAYYLKFLRPDEQWQHLKTQDFKYALQNYADDMILPMCVGVDEHGKPCFEDLTEAPHLLIGGTTGSGKSVLVRTLLRSLFDLAKGQDKMEVAILDPKKVDYHVFEQEEDLWEERILDDYDEMFEFLNDCVKESENRYLLMKEYGVSKLAQLPSKIRPRYRIVVVDEVANLIDNRDGIERLLSHLAEKARASGIHLILSTQRPDAKIFEGRLRSNLPSRIALKVQKSTESKIILDEVGAEHLLGKGDHLVKWNNGQTYFLHGFDL